MLSQGDEVTLGTARVGRRRWLLGWILCLWVYLSGEGRGERGREKCLSTVARVRIN